MMANIPLLRLSSNSLNTETQEMRGYGLPTISSSKQPSIRDSYLPKTKIGSNSRSSLASTVSNIGENQKYLEILRRSQNNQNSDDDDDDDYLDEKVSHLSMKRETRGPIESIREEKVGELSKKIKTLTIALEKEKAHNSSLQKDLKKMAIALEEERLPKTAGPNMEEEKQLREKVIFLSRKLEQEQVKSETIKRDLKIASKILKAELGTSDFTQLEKQCNSSWRGRAQQITLLKERIKELEASPGTSGNNSMKQLYPPSDSGSIYSREKRSSLGTSVTHQQQLGKVVGELAQVKEDHDRIRQKYLGAKARVKVLEDQLGDTRKKLGVVLEKTALDDQMIAKLQNELRLHQ